MKTIKIGLSTLLFCLSLTTNAQNTNTMQQRIQSMSKEKLPEKNISSMQQIIRDFKLDPIKNAEDIDVLKGQVALSLVKTGRITACYTYINQMKNKFNQTSFLNMATYLLINDKKWNEASTMAQNTIARYESYKDNPLARPVNFPLEDWNRFMQMAAAPYYEAYAETLHAQGEDKQALLYQEKAIKDRALEELMQSSIELYTILLEADGQLDKAYKILLEMASMGKASITMSNQLKKLTVKKFASEEKAISFLDSIQANINNKYKTEIAKKMITNVAAPNFCLLDLNGKSISLNDLKGKIVVLDFWATWCAPCIASMPAMKKLSDKHPEVVFLFIATQESDPEAKARVQAYVKKNKFPLNLLLDQADAKNPKLFAVVNSYQAKGIPAKMVIDKHGKLRFSTEGYASDSELINELEAMIAIAKAQ